LFAKGNGKDVLWGVWLWRFSGGNRRCTRCGGAEG